MVFQGRLFSAHQSGQALKIDAMGLWLETEWLPRYPERALVILIVPRAVVHHQVLTGFDRTRALPHGYTFAGGEPLSCPVAPAVSLYDGNGALTYRGGAFVYHFLPSNGSGPVDVAVLAAYFSDEVEMVCLAAMPQDFVPVWNAFDSQCKKLAAALEPLPRVQVIGGQSSSFEPTVEWDDVVLPPDLKDELMRDVESFFSKGVEIYKRLKLKPFRKLLLAGVPGTGKTMLCAALARWALARDYLVIYISSNDYAGAAFWKIEHALAVAANSELPTLILLEELDAYVKDEDVKALVLNVLDGAEARENERGTLLIATTNYPEAIDARVLKRPGRLDRIFIIPEARTAQNAEAMLRKYLGDQWRDEHVAVARSLVGYPGAFIREVALYALTQVAYQGLDSLPLELLERSFERLLDQITARDDFLTAHRQNGFGFVTATAS